MTDDLPIESTDYWVKVVEMLQQNWALIEPGPVDRVFVYFVSDTSGVFHEMAFPSVQDASGPAARCFGGPQKTPCSR
jgi:hypothetical protein